VLESKRAILRDLVFFESTGLPLHEDNATIVKEKIYLDRNNSDILHDEITTIDNALSRPWTVDRIYLRVRVPLWIEKNSTNPTRILTIVEKNIF